MRWLHCLFTAKAALLALVLLGASAQAQNSICPDVTTGDISNRCANTRFVNNQIVATGITVGSTLVNGGTSGRVIFDNAGIAGEYPITGTAGNVVLSNNPTIAGLTVTGSLTATGLVTNADLVNSSTTVNGQTCTLGSTCTLTAANINYTATGASAVARTIQQMLDSQWFNLLSWTSTADTATNQTAGFQAAITAAAGQTVYIPCGNWSLNGNLQMLMATNLIGAGQSCVNIDISGVSSVTDVVTIKPQTIKAGMVISGINWTFTTAGTAPARDLYHVDTTGSATYYLTSLIIHDTTLSGTVSSVPSGINRYSLNLDNQGANIGGGIFLSSFYDNNWPNKVNIFEAGDSLHFYHNHLTDLTSQCFFIRLVSGAGNFVADGGNNLACKEGAALVDAGASIQFFGNILEQTGTASGGAVMLNYRGGIRALDGGMILNNQIQIPSAGLGDPLPINVDNASRVIVGSNVISAHAAGTQINVTANASFVTLGTNQCNVNGVAAACTIANAGASVGQEVVASTIGTTTTVLHGNASTGIGAYGAVALATDISGLGTGVATALGVNIGTAGSFVVNGGALGSPSSAGTIPAHTLGGTISGGGNNINNVNIGVVSPGTGAFTTLHTSGSATFVTSTNTSGASISVRNTTLPGPGVEFGNNITSVIGADSFGTPYLGLGMYAGATGGKYTTESLIAGVVMASDGAGGVFFAGLATSQTNQTPTKLAYIQASGGFGVGTATDPGAGAILANTTIKALGTTVSTSPTTGSGIFGGGIGVSGDVWASGNHSVSVAAKTLLLKQGANGAVGTFVCNGVTPVTVSNTNVAITDAVIISLNTVGGTVGAAPDLKTITGATGFTVACTAADTSTYNYALIKNAA